MQYPPPISRLTLSGTDIAYYTVIVPANADEDTKYAATLLVRCVESACGVTLSVQTDNEASNGSCEIVLGKTARDIPTVVTRRATLRSQGYVHYARGTCIYITGATGKGTLNGVVCFLEDRLGYRFFTADCEAVTLSGEVSVPAELDVSYEPTFSFRCSFYQFADTEYDRLHKLRGIVYAHGARVHTMFALAEMTGTATGNQPCMTDSTVYTTVLKNVRAWLMENPNATVISVSQNDSYEEQLGCQCDDCKALNAKYGTEGGALFDFVNRIACDIKDEFPDVLVETLAYRYSVVPPIDFKFADNVVVQLCIMDACYTHALNNPDCTQNYRFAEFLENWYPVCNRISIWDYHTVFSNYHTIFPNYYTLYDHITYYASHNVVSVFNQGNYNSLSGQFEELRSYLCSAWMWNPTMTYEEYLNHADEFLRYYYGDGWEYIRRFMDCTDARAKENGNHFSLYTAPEKILHYKAGDTADAAYADRMVALFDQAFAVAKTDAQRAHIEKSSIQARYYRQYNLTESISDPDGNEQLFALMQKYNITRLHEGKPLSDVNNPKLPPRNW